MINKLIALIVSSAKQEIVMSRWHFPYNDQHNRRIIVQAIVLPLHNYLFLDYVSDYFLLQMNNILVSKFFCACVIIYHPSCVWWNMTYFKKVKYAHLISCFTINYGHHRTHNMKRAIFSVNWLHFIIVIEYHCKANWTRTKILVFNRTWCYY